MENSQKSEGVELSESALHASLSSMCDAARDVGRLSVVAFDRITHAVDCLGEDGAALRRLLGAAATWADAMGEREKQSSAQREVDEAPAQGQG